MQIEDGWYKDHGRRPGGFPPDRFLYRGGECVAIVSHCGHPTALRPYGTTVDGRKHRTLKAAKLYVEDEL